jgi:4-diphosphocytidyl-2-C-methyl-D-erythritol kinase
MHDHGAISDPRFSYIPALICDLNIIGICIIAHSPPPLLSSRVQSNNRGEVVENVPPPLPLDTPLLLVKPPIGLSTPDIFKALDLTRRSAADPRQLLADLSSLGAQQAVCVNDLEQPAFDRLPALAELKTRLIEEGGGACSSVFMTGSGSTIVCVGSDVAPAFLKEGQYSDLFVAPARLIVRQPGEWYPAPTRVVPGVA